MAKKRSKRDRFADRKRVDVDWGAATNTFRGETINTGMNIGSRDPFKWILVGALVGPGPIGNGPSAVGVDLDLQFQIQLGEHDDLVASDSTQLISETMWSMYFTTSGKTNSQWPIAFPILSPIPVFASEITVGMEASADRAELQNKPWYFELVYFPAPVAQDELVEYLAAYGQA